MDGVNGKPGLVVMNTQVMQVLFSAWSSPV